MNTKFSAVYYFHRKAEFWTRLGVLSAALALAQMVWIGWLLVQLHNCYSG